LAQIVNITIWSLAFQEGYSYICKFDMDMNIGVGKYSLTTAIHSSFDHLEECVHWVDNACEFEIAGVKVISL